MARSRLRSLRLEARLTQFELAKLSDIDPSYLSQLETAESIPNVGLRTCRKLTTALSQRLGRRVTVDELFPEDREEEHYSSSQATKTA